MQFFFENEQGQAVTVNADRYRGIEVIVVLKNGRRMEEWILATIGFNRTAQRATHPKLHSMFCALFLKIALSAAKLMSFGHLGAAI